MQLIKITLITLVISLISCKSAKYDNLEDGLYADIETSKGDILLKLEYENVPITVANFVSLAEGVNPYVSEEFKEKHFYDGLKFHRVVENFVIQGGDPRGNGTGGPGYVFEDEFPMDEEGDLIFSHNGAGILSMANGGPDANGSQFFITHKEIPHLDGVHSIFGHLIKGQDVVNAIQENDIINKIEIIRVGNKVKEFDAAEVFTSYFSRIEEEKKLKTERKEKAKADLLKFIEENTEKATVMPSGLKIIKLKEGNGVKPVIGTKVPVFYAGYFTSGDLFDSNIKEIATIHGKYDRRRESGGGYNPSRWDYSPDASLIAGFKEGLQLMNFGDKVLLIIPSHLGFGSQGDRIIPPNSDLIFELEIVDEESK